VVRLPLTSTPKQELDTIVGFLKRRFWNPGRVNTGGQIFSDYPPARIVRSLTLFRSGRGGEANILGIPAVHK
jgi:hypothetical protein